MWKIVEKSNEIAKQAHQKSRNKTTREEWLFTKNPDRKQRQSCQTWTDTSEYIGSLPEWYICKDEQRMHSQFLTSPSSDSEEWTFQFSYDSEKAYKKVKRFMYPARAQGHLFCSPFSHFANCPWKVAPESYCEICILRSFWSSFLQCQTPHYLRWVSTVELKTNACEREQRIFDHFDLDLSISLLFLEQGPVF